MGSSKPSPATHALDIYGAQLHATWTPKQWRKVARTIGRPDAKAPESAGRVDSSLWVPDVGLPVFHLLIYVDLKNHGDDTAALVDCIAHESAHAAGAILDHIGQPYDGDTSEAHAYLVGWIAAWLWRQAGLA